MLGLNWEKSPTGKTLAAADLYQYQGIIVQMVSFNFEKEALKYIDQLYYTALRLTANQGDAQDLVQETYLKACKAWPKLPDHSNCKAWLYKIMINTWKNLKLRRSREVYLQGEKELEIALEKNAILAPTAGLEAEARSRMMAEAADRALHEMPEQQRVLIYLTDIEGFSYKEISDILSIPIGTVMSRLFRARDRLKKIMTNFYPRLENRD